MCIFDCGSITMVMGEEVKQTVSTTLAQAERMSAPRAIALCKCFSGALEFLAGYWDASEEALRDSIQLYRELGAASGEAIACQRLGVLLTARGQLAEGLMVLEQGISVAERATMRAHCLTRLYAAITTNRLAAGELTAAGAALELGLIMSERHGHCTTCDALLLPAAVSLHIATGDFEAALRFCQQLERAAFDYGSRMWVAMAQQANGELAAARGDLEQALAAYSEAREAFLSANNAFEAARCLAAIAEIQTRRNGPGDMEDALAARQAARQTFERLGVA
jgi:ATP/maltotriose-dependent transcriptional regulator MalT